MEIDYFSIFALDNDSVEGGKTRLGLFYTQFFFSPSHMDHGENEWLIEYMADIHLITMIFIIIQMILLNSYISVFFFLLLLFHLINEMYDEKKKREIRRD